jgi:hypothetical protein
VGLDRRLGAAAGGFVAVAFLAAAVAGLSVGRGQEGAEDPEASGTPTSSLAPAAGRGAPPLRPIDVVLLPFAGDDRFAPPAQVLDELPDRTTRFVAVATDAAGVLVSCVLGDDDQPRDCGHATPIGHANGIHAALIEVERTLRTAGGASVDCAIERCALVAVDEDGTAPIAIGARLVFGVPATTPTLRIAAPGVEGAGDQVTAELRGLRARERVELTWCVPPGPVDARACGSVDASTAVAVTAGPDGAATATIAVPAHVGEREASCGPRSACSLVVRGASAPVAPVAIDFAGADGPDLPASRVAAGLTIAVLLGALALWLVRTREPSQPDPFAEVSLDVPEWDGIDLSIDTDAENALETAPGLSRGS